MEVNLEGISELALAFLKWLGALDLKGLNTSIMPALSNYIRPIVVYILGMIGL